MLVNKCGTGKVLLYFLKPKFRIRLTSDFALRIHMQMSNKIDHWLCLLIFPKQKNYTEFHFDRMILLMEEILHHLLHMKPYEKCDILNVNWCRSSSINSRLAKHDVLTYFCGGIRSQIPNEKTFLMAKVQTDDKVAIENKGGLIPTSSRASGSTG